MINADSELISVVFFSRSFLKLVLFEFSTIITLVFYSIEFKKS